jgi:hypothetical protein
MAKDFRNEFDDLGFTDLCGDDPSLAKIPQPLDVLLVRGTSLESTALCVSQGVLMRRPVHFSHAIVTIMQGVYLQATGDGVYPIRPADVWSSPHYRSRKLVLRNRRVAAMTIDLQSKAAYQRATETYGKRYNYWIGIPKKLIKQDAWFCSELAANHLQAVGQCVYKGRSPERTWPGHFEHRKNHDAWMDVTKVHHDYAEWTIRGQSQDAPAHCRAAWSQGEAMFQMAELTWKLNSSINKCDRAITRATAQLRDALTAIREFKGRRGQ